jgi:N-glycosylase/DNA lyase
VFRWERLPDGSWLGVDGPFWFHVQVSNYEKNSSPLEGEHVHAPREQVGGAFSSPREGEDVHAQREQVGGRSKDYAINSNAPISEFQRLFRLEIKLSDIETAILKRGPELAPCVEGLKGLRVLQPKDPEEVLFCFLCTPNNNLERITRMVKKLSEYGQPLGEVDGRTIHRFPTAERIAAIPEQELRSKGFGYRGKSIPNVARQLLERPEGWLQSLKEAPYEQAHEELCRLTGVGPKLADCICLFGLNHLEAVPVDTHLWQAACRSYFPEFAGGSLTGARYKVIGDHFRQRFGPLAGWAHQYLFYENLRAFRSGRSGAKARAASKSGPGKIAENRRKTRVRKSTISARNPV